MERAVRLRQVRPRMRDRPRRVRAHRAAQQQRRSHALPFSRGDRRGEVPGSAAAVPCLVARQQVSQRGATHGDRSRGADDLRGRGEARCRSAGAGPRHGTRSPAARRLPGFENPEGLPRSDEGEICTLRQGINQALRTEFRKNKDTYLWGQDIANGKKEGIFKVSDGMQAEFGPERVFNAPIAENFILGTAVRVFSRSRTKRSASWSRAPSSPTTSGPASTRSSSFRHLEYWRTRGQVLAPTWSSASRPAATSAAASTTARTSRVHPRQRCPACAVVHARLRRRRRRSSCAPPCAASGVTFYLEPKYLYNQPKTRCTVSGRLRRARSARVVYAVAAERDVTVICVRHRRAPRPRRPRSRSLKEEIDVEVFDLPLAQPAWTSTALRESVKPAPAAWSVVPTRTKLFGGFGGEIASQIIATRMLRAPRRSRSERVGQDYIPTPFHKGLEAAMQLTPNESSTRSSVYLLTSVTCFADALANANVKPGFPFYALRVRFYVSAIRLR